MSENDFNDLIKLMRSILDNSDSTEEMNRKFKAIWQYLQEMSITSYK